MDKTIKNKGYLQPTRGKVEIEFDSFVDGDLVIDLSDHGSKESIRHVMEIEDCKALKELLDEHISQYEALQSQGKVLIKTEK